MTLVPTSTDVRSQDLSRDLQGHKDHFEASQEGKWWCQAIRDPSPSSTKALRRDRASAALLTSE